MTHKDDALRIAAKFLTAGFYGKPFTRQEMKVIGDLCWLALPMKYRLSRDEFDQLRTCEDGIQACATEASNGR